MKCGLSPIGSMAETPFRSVDCLHIQVNECPVDSPIHNVVLKTRFELKLQKNRAFTSATEWAGRQSRPLLFVSCYVLFQEKLLVKLEVLATTRKFRLKPLLPCDYRILMGEMASMQKEIHTRRQILRREYRQEWQLTMEPVCLRMQTLHPLPKSQDKIKRPRKYIQELDKVLRTLKRYSLEKNFLQYLQLSITRQSIK